MIEAITRTRIARTARRITALIGVGIAAFCLLRTLFREGTGRSSASESESPTLLGRPGRRGGGLPDDRIAEGFQTPVADLRIVEGPDSGKTFAVGGPIVLIGRRGRRTNDIELTDTTISREQARLQYNEETGAFTLVNEGRTNPTRVNGLPIDTCELPDDARIQMGRTVAALERRE